MYRRVGYLQPAFGGAAPSVLCFIYRALAVDHSIVRDMSIHSEPAEIGGAGHPAEEPEPKRRADAERNLERIIAAATTLLAVNPGASMAEIAEASGLVRATLYRHFPTREDLMREMYSAA